MGPQERSRPPDPGTLNLRILSALVLAPLVLAAEYFGSPAFELLVFLAAAILAWEWGRMWVVSPQPGATILLAIAVIAGCGATAASQFILALVLLGIGGTALLWLTRRAWFSAGVLYLGLPCMAILWLRADPAYGFEIVIWLFVIVWASDIGAYGAGKLIGGPKLMPSVSPNKTWAGAIGGLVASVAIGGSLAVSLAPVENVIAAFCASGAIGIVGQLGDLFESWIKRRLAVKDTGGLIPGHGGLLDRIDSLMAAAVATALMMVVSRSTVLPWM